MGGGIAGCLRLSHENLKYWWKAKILFFRLSGENLNFQDELAHVLT